jgi:hypothetical protein
MTIAGGGREEQHQWEHADEQRGVSPGKMDAGVAHSEVAWRGGGRRNRGSAVGGLRKRGGQPAAAAVKGRGKDRRRCRPSDARPGRSSGRISETHREADARPPHPQAPSSGHGAEGDAGSNDCGVDFPRWRRRNGGREGGGGGRRKATGVVVRRREGRFTVTGWMTVAPAGRIDG